MNDRSTKALLLLIAAGLWLHLAGDWLRPTPVQAQGVLDRMQANDVAKDISAMHLDLSLIERHLADVGRDVSACRTGVVDSLRAMEPEVRGMKENLDNLVAREGIRPSFPKR